MNEQTNAPKEEYNDPLGAYISTTPGTQTQEVAKFLLNLKGSEANTLVKTENVEYVANKPWKQ